ncbi:hypothetical protein BVJ53_09815 [Lacticaseibacillus chiayiensis]|uniref:DUF2075 domain-containing protein n=1 Tax=Lacticaseibacillus chiayiensis TaxID=2100821 RepID=A0A4Q1TQD8_9LACO|nr:DUF2075 domain-containing protein [Lacticaseibacillus chiayiensis]QVI34197.1 DUF2075 domain-containing protein [Lacticaseibacillus chiayiensis]RXT20876.1 hypothetical protein BVJ53_09815 [Lacticaseibacillus chiayiensis]RXT57947.1 hypothetical protein CHT97_09435 [Lacticaseibacillus chiayiensis]UYN55977.1 DUF2075 domain-containing protein [Lacticaseibacillus chiayiensis]
MPDLAQSTFVLPQDAALTSAQAALKQHIYDFIITNYSRRQTHLLIISGDAGSGKSVVLDAAFAQLQQAARADGGTLAGTDNKLLVNHNEMLKIYKEIAGTKTYFRKKDFMKPTPFINAYRKLGKKADVVFIDEGHLLLTAPDPYNNFRDTNQLADILHLAKLVVLVFDFHQLVKLKSFWTPALLKRVTRDYPVTHYRLTEQMRVGDAAVSHWIDQFVRGRITPMPQSTSFDFRIFADGQPMYQLIQQRDAAVGLSRMIATADYPFTVLDNKTWYVTAGSLRLPWDKINFTDRPWAQRPETLHEVGSIYTIQGFDLNYAGVILGPSLGYDRQRDRLTVNLAQYQDKEAFKKRPNLADTQDAKAAIMMNAINILLKRAKHGLYLYAADPALRERLLEGTKR